MNEKLLKPKRQPHLMIDVIKDQDFAWNKHVKLFFDCHCSWKCYQLMCFGFCLFCDW